MEKLRARGVSISDDTLARARLVEPSIGDGSSTLSAEVQVGGEVKPESDEIRAENLRKALEAVARAESFQKSVLERKAESVMQKRQKELDEVFILLGEKTPVRGGTVPKPRHVDPLRSTLSQDIRDQLEVYKRDHALRKAAEEQLLSFRQQPVFHIPDLAQTRPKVIELAVPRSGSTFVLSLFSIIDNAFSLPEPYNMFDVNQTTLKEWMNPRAHMPSVSSLLDCTFVNGDAVRNIFWEFACNHIKWIVQDPFIHKECIEGTISLDDVRQQCSSAQLKFVKILRAPLLVSQFGNEVFPRDVSIINVVRAPWDVFMSQYKAGWFTDQQLPYYRMVPKGVEPLAFHMARICSHFLLNHNLTTAHPASQTLTVQYEDLMQDFTHWTSKIFDFVGVHLTSPMQQVLATIKDQVHAPIVGKPVSKIMLSAADAKRLALGIMECRNVIQLFGYS